MKEFINLASSPDLRSKDLSWMVNWIAVSEKVTELFCPDEWKP